MILFSRKKLLLVLFAFALSSCGPGRPHIKTLELTRAGNKFLQGQSYAAAMDKYLEALRYDPFASELHLNLGLSFEGLQQAEKAMQSYKAAETLAEQELNKSVLFMARFNQAQLLGKAKKIDEALALYQKALEVVPTSKETKTNIELLTQNQQGQGGGGDNKDQKDQKDQQNQDQQDQKDQEKKEDQPKQVQQSPKYKPRPFQGKELSEMDVKKILGELKQQEEKIRAEYNRKEMKEQPRDKDW